MTVLFVFQILSSIFGFLNKIFLFLGKKSGWLIGFLAGIFFVIYFFLIGFYVYTVVQIGFCILMLYGYFSHESTSSKLKTVATIIVFIVCMIVTVITFDGRLTVLEAISALLALMGTYFLGSKKSIAGWGSYFIAHIILIYLTFFKQQYFFSFFQAASAIVSIMTILKQPHEARRL